MSHRAMSGVSDNASGVSWLASPGAGEDSVFVWTAGGGGSPGVLGVGNVTAAERDEFARAGSLTLAVTAGPGEVRASAETPISGSGKRIVAHAAAILDEGGGTQLLLTLSAGARASLQFLGMLTPRVNVTHAGETKSALLPLHTSADLQERGTR